MGHAVALREVRAWWRVRHPGPSLGKQLDVAYTAAIVAAIFGALAYGTASSALSQVVTPGWLAGYGPALALGAVLLTAHWGAYQGPVVFSVADVAHLLGAPLPRRALAARRLARSLGLGALVGVVSAGLVIVGLAGEGRGIAVSDAAGLALAGAALAVLGVAGAWLVERSARWERLTRRATWPAALAAAALAALAPGRSLGRGAWLAALAPLGAAAALAAVAALRGCGHCPAERHLRRAEARASAVASLASYDARTARRTLETVGLRGPGGRAAGLGRVRSARLAVPWRDAASALRTPGRTVEGAALAAAGTVLAALNADRPVTLAAAMLVLYAGAARLLWPLRAELDVPDRARVLLRARFGDVLLAHALVPIAVTTAAALLAGVGCALGGAGLGAALVAAAVAPAVTLCAAMAARREGRLPTSLLVRAASTDPSGGLGAVVAWFALWPSVAAVLGAAAVYLASRGLPDVGAACLALATLVLPRLLARDAGEAA